MINDEIKSNMMPWGGRMLALYGAGLAGEKFYCRYSRQYNIGLVMDRIAGRYFHGQMVYYPEEVKSELKKYFIVVAAEDIQVYREIRDWLLSIDLLEFQDFVYSKGFCKKLAILYGNCHFNVLERYLDNNPFFAAEYEVRFYYLKNPPEEELKNCALLVAQDVRGVMKPESVV
ncbi:MAG: hypothetical protein IJT96_08600 [Lachnospiraceae bacterium]|nr:hypothetical protein [Lachnospiraceae bacterium]